MKRLCIFAHWDKDNIVDDYVIYYLKALREICETIIFVSDANLSCSETDKLSDLADYILAKRHGEYDFGSYKRGFQLAVDKALDYDELIFANDSCYGPFCSLIQIMDKMSKDDCDYWGMTKNYLGITKRGNDFYEAYCPHIQSYFLVFKKRVFKSSEFCSFLQNITAMKEKNDIIINYEIGLSKLLKKHGFKGNVCFNYFSHCPNALLTKRDKLLKRGFPFLKTCAVDCESIKKMGINSYPVELIIAHKQRVSEQADANTKISFISFLPAELYICIKLFDRKIISTIRRIFRDIV